MRNHDRGSGRLRTALEDLDIPDGRIFFDRLEVGLTVGKLSGYTVAGHRHTLRQLEIVDPLGAGGLGEAYVHKPPFEKSVAPDASG
jgi:hypothetical protein